MIENKIFAIVKQKGGYLFFVFIHPFESRIDIIPKWVLEQLNCKDEQECVEYLSRFSPAEFEPVTDDWRNVPYNYHGIYVGYNYDNVNWGDYLANIIIDKILDEDV